MYTIKDITYRVGTTKDITGLIFFLENIKQENPLVDLFEYDLVKCAEVLKRIIEQDQGVILIAEKNDTIIGTIILGKTIIWWTNKAILTDLVFYVNPEFRNIGVQNKLLDIVKDFAKNTDMPVLIDVFNNSDKNDKFTRYLSFKGFNNVGFKTLFIPKKE